MPVFAVEAGQPDPQVLSTMTDDLCAVSSMSGNAGASAVWPAANTALFFPVRIADAHTYVKAWWVNGATAAGNVDVGLFTISGTTATRVVVSTAEAQAGVSAVQVAATFSSTTVQPGLYYLGMSASLGTATMWRASPNGFMLRTVGVFQSSAAAHPMGATITVTTMAYTFMPLFGLSELSTI